jgi:DNA-binding CsgD family transcriptional regulator
METRGLSDPEPQFTAEETILLHCLASGSTVKQIAGRLRLTRETLFRLLGDLRRKTGVRDDAALAGWVLRNEKSLKHPN